MKISRRIAEKLRKTQEAMGDTSEEQQYNVIRCLPLRARKQMFKFLAQRGTEQDIKNILDALVQAVLDSRDTPDYEHYYRDYEMFCDYIKKHRPNYSL